jgi:hypothetical protein
MSKTGKNTPDSNSDSDPIDTPPIVVCKNDREQIKKQHPEPFVSTRMRPSDYASFFNVFVLTSYILSDMNKKPK